MGSKPRFKSYDDLVELRAFIRNHPCTVRNERCWGATEVDHIVTRGAGGMDRDNTIPLCKAHHAERHHIGILSFQKKHDLEALVVARELTRIWEQEHANGSQD